MHTVIGQIILTLDIVPCLIFFFFLLPCNYLRCESRPRVQLPRYAMMSDKRGGGRLSNLPRKLRYSKYTLFAHHCCHEKIILLFGKLFVLNGFVIFFFVCLFFFENYEMHCFGFIVSLACLFSESAEG